MPNEPDFDRPPDIAFTVAGIPAPGGSKRGFAIKKGGVYTGRVAIMDDAGQRNKDWKAYVRTAGAKHRGEELLTCPLEVTFHFYLPRPKGHFNAKGQLRPSAPKYPITKPDVLKLARSTEDALSGVIWRDDNATISLRATKEYSLVPGCTIIIRKIPCES